MILTSIDVVGDGFTRTIAFICRHCMATTMEAAEPVGADSDVWCASCGAALATWGAMEAHARTAALQLGPEILELRGVVAPFHVVL